MTIFREVSVERTCNMNEIRVFLMTKEGQEVMKKQQKKHTFISDPKAVYQDHFVAVRSDYLVVKHFFIPSMISYDFPWDKIKSITYIAQCDDEKSKTKAKGLDEEGRWWADDVLRPYERELHLYNVRITTDTEPPKSGFTVEDIDGFVHACRPFLPFSCEIRYAVQ